MPAEAAPGVAVEQLQLTDAAATAAWLARLPLKNAAQCHALLAAQAQLLTAAPIAPTAKLEVLPGWHQGNRVLHLRAEKEAKIRLQALLDSGSNFERATYIAG